jgi:hypothetical protein
MQTLVEEKAKKERKERTHEQIRTRKEELEKARRGDTA